MLVELVDQGLSVEEIASRTGKLVASVQKQLNRVRRKVREGHFAPSPLIERAAMTPRVYIAGFDVFRSDAFSHGRGYIADNFGLSGNLMQACTGQIVVGDVSAWHDASRTSTNRTKVPLAFETDARSVASRRMGKAPFQYIDFMHSTNWLIDPEGSYASWQAEEAAGADRRPFAEQSIVQHRAMFSRFHRYLSSRGQTVATFGPDHIDGFLIHIAPDCADGTTTQIRYLKLIDRLTRFLVDVGVRQENPAATMLPTQSWLEDEPTPVYLSFEHHERLQRSLVVPDDHPKIIRNKAVVALLAASGITSAELKRLKRPNLVVGGIRPDVAIAKSGPRLARKVPIDAFALEVLTAYLAKRDEMTCTSEWLFVATAAGKPVKDDTLGQCVRNALAEVDVAAADMSPRLLRNTYCRRQLRAGKTNEQVSSLLGLSSHRKTVRIRQTIEAMCDPHENLSLP